MGHQLLVCNRAVAHTCSSSHSLIYMHPSGVPQGSNFGSLYIYILEHIAHVREHVILEVYTDGLKVVEVKPTGVKHDNNLW